MNKNLSLIVGLIAIVLVIGGIYGLSGNGKNPEKPSNEAQRPVVRIPTPDLGMSVINIVAEKKGFFEQEGVTVEKVGALTTPVALTALAAGEIDVLGFHPDMVIERRLSGLDFKIIVGASDATKEYPHMSFVVLENSTIQTAKDLKGKKIGMSVIMSEGCIYYSLSEYLKTGGLTINDVEQVTMPDMQQFQGLQQGLIDVATFHAPYSGKPIYTGGRRLFTDFDTINGAEGGIAATEKFIRNNPESVKRYVSAIVKAEDWTNAHLDEADKIIAEELELDPSTARYMDRRVWIDHGLMTDEIVQKWMNIMIKYGNLKEGEIKISDVYTNEFNPYAK